MEISEELTFSTGRFSGERTNSHDRRILTDLSYEPIDDVPSYAVKVREFAPTNSEFIGDEINLEWRDITMWLTFSTKPILRGYQEEYIRAKC